MLSRNRTTDNGMPTLSDILKFAREKFPDNEVISQKSIIVNGFNFNEFSSTKDKDAQNGIFSLVYNEDGDISQIVQRLHEGSDTFEFHVVHNKKDNYRILFIYDSISGGERNWIDGFILNYNRTSYFIGENGFDHSSVFANVKNLSSFMELDKNLKAMRTLKFEFGKCLHRTEVKYKHDRTLFSEILLTYKQPWEVTDKTPLSEMLDRLTSDNANLTLAGEKIIELEENYSYRPLWVYNGIHVYKN